MSRPVVTAEAAHSAECAPNREVRVPGKQKQKTEMMEGTKLFLNLNLQT